MTKQIEFGRVGLIADQDHRLGDEPQPAADIFIERRQPGADIDDKQNDMRLLDGQVDLAFDFGGQVVNIFDADAAGINQFEEPPAGFDQSR